MKLVNLKAQGNGSDEKLGQVKPEEDWYDLIVTKLNALWAVFIIGLVVIWGCLMYQTMVLKTEYDNQVTFNQDWEMQVNDIKTKQGESLYLPTAKTMKLTPEQRHGIKWLHDFFVKITTFNDTTTYTIGYQYAKAHVQDQDLYREFLPKPKDRGENDDSQTRIYRHNVKTQVIVIGKNTYLVGVTYRTRKFNSSFNEKHEQKETTKIATKWFKCHGKGQIWDKVELVKDMQIVK